MKMKIAKRLLALGLCTAMLVGCLSGCGKTAESGSGTEKKEEAEIKEEVKEEVKEVNLKGEKLTIWMPQFWAGQLNDHNDNDAWKKVEETLGIELEFLTPAIGTESEQFNLMIASGEYPDIIFGDWYGTNLFEGGIDKYIDDGILLDLTDLIPQYAPNYMNAINNLVPEKELPYLYTDAGRMAGFYGISPYLDGASGNLVIRQDWLNELGIEIPTTIQEYEDMLVRFKEEKGATAAFNLAPNGFSPFEYAFAPGAFFNDNGTVKYGFIEPEYKEYLTLMHDWYERGLIDKDFATRDVTTVSQMIFENQIGMTSHTNADSIRGYIGDLTDVECGNWPVKNEGDKVQYQPLPTYVKYAFFPAFISTTCEKPEVALTFLDYGYTEEGMLLYNYGIEGETYELTGETVSYGGMTFPVIQYTDKMLNNPDYTLMDAILQFKIHCGPFIRFENEGNPTIVVTGDKGVQERIHLAETAGTDQILPAYSLLPEESDAYGKVMSQVDTYVQTSILEFIMGTRSLDEFDDYVKTVEDMGIGTAIEMVQTAVDRFYNRVSE